METQQKQVFPIDHLAHGCRVNILGQEPLYGCDNKYTFYYDETNNIRKLHVTEGVFNATPRSFVLGGICLSPKAPQLEAAEVRRLLYIQENASEIKLKHIGKGDFIRILNSKSLQPFLQHLLTNKINIHFSVLDTLYWSVVDIVDSVCANFPKFIPFSLNIKNTIYNACSSNTDTLAKIFNNFGYPNLQRDQAAEFMLEIAQFVSTNSVNNAPPGSDRSAEFKLFLDLTLNLLKQGASSPTLTFIENNDDSDSKLIESFIPFFLRPLYTYPFSTHFFDEEDEISVKLKKFEYQYQGNPIVYKFQKSTNHLEIQLSDIICGLIGKYYDFLAENSLDKLHSAKLSLNDRQKSNLLLLIQLINNSDAESNGFFHFLLPFQTQEKNQYFMYNNLEQ